MAEESASPCELAQMRYHNFALWLNLWTVLLYAFGVAVIIFLILSVFLFIRKDWLPGALTTLGTIVESIGIKWVLDRRAAARKEEEEAYKDVEVKCGDTTGPDILRCIGSDGFGQIGDLN